MHPDAVTYKPSMGKLHNLSGSSLSHQEVGILKVTCLVLQLNMFIINIEAQGLPSKGSLFFMVIISIARVVTVSLLTLLPGACYLWIVPPGEDAEALTRSTCDRVCMYFLC